MVRHFGGHRYDRRLRAGALLAMAVTTIGRGTAYLTPSWDTTSHVSFVDTLVPIEVWAVVWIGAGLAMLVGIRCPRVARWSMSTAASLWGTWAVSYLIAWVVLDTARAWVTAMPFGLIAILTLILTVLMEPPQTVKGDA